MTNPIWRDSDLWTDLPRKETFLCILQLCAEYTDCSLNDKKKKKRVRWQLERKRNSAIVELSNFDSRDADNGNRNPCWSRNSCCPNLSPFLIHLQFKWDDLSIYSNISYVMICDGVLQLLLCVKNRTRAYHPARKMNRPYIRGNNKDLSIPNKKRLGRDSLVFTSDTTWLCSLSFVDIHCGMCAASCVVWQLSYPSISIICLPNWNRCRFNPTQRRRRKKKKKRRMETMRKCILFSMFSFLFLYELLKEIFVRRKKKEEIGYHPTSSSSSRLCGWCSILGKSSGPVCVGFWCENIRL